MGIAGEMQLPVYFVFPTGGYLFRLNLPCFFYGKCVIGLSKYIFKVYAMHSARRGGGMEMEGVQPFILLTKT